MPLFNIELAVEVFAEIMVAVQALHYARKKRTDHAYRYAALIAMVGGILWAGINIASFFVTDIPDLHLTQVVVLNIIIFLMLQRSPHADEGALVLQRLNDALTSLERIAQRMEIVDEQPPE